MSEPSAQTPVASRAVRFFDCFAASASHRVTSARTVDFSFWNPHEANPRDPNNSASTIAAVVEVASASSAATRLTFQNGTPPATAASTNRGVFVHAVTAAPNRVEAVRGASWQAAAKSVSAKSA